MGGSSRGVRPTPSAPQGPGILPQPSIGPVQQPNPAPAENYAPYYAGQGLNGMRQAVMQGQPNGINRAAFNPQAVQSLYAAPRAPQVFRPQFSAPVPTAPVAQAPTQPTEMDQRLKTLEEQNQQLRNWSGYRDGGGYA